MTVYLVTCNWHGSWQIGIYSSQARAEKAIEKHLKCLKNEIYNPKNISKNNYEISEILLNKNISNIPLDIISNDWYNNGINSKE